MTKNNFEIEKLPNLKCPKCNSDYVIMTASGIECDNCERPDVHSVQKDLKKIRKFNQGENQQ